MQLLPLLPKNTYDDPDSRKWLLADLPMVQGRQLPDAGPDSLRGMKSLVALRPGPPGR